MHNVCEKEIKLTLFIGHLISLYQNQYELQKRYMNIKLIYQVEVI